jgi:hypothetical protein
MAHVISSLGLADWILKVQFSDKNSFILLKYIIFLPHTVFFEITFP